ncbi:MAG: hypothetical protein R2932_43150 [Caldilineaceae bacterium]
MANFFFSFCANYTRASMRGYCAGDNPASWPQPSNQIRGQLVRKQEMFGFWRWPTQPK